MNTAQEALFKDMLFSGWFTKSGGDVEAPTGYYGYVSNDWMEMSNVYDVFDETIEAYGKPDDSEFVGNYFAWVNSDGIITINKTLTRTEAEDLFDRAELEYGKWSA